MAYNIVGVFVIFEAIYNSTPQLFVSEHVLQLLCELATALRFQFAQHGFLRIIWDAFVEEQPLRQVLFIEFFEDILFLEESEKNHGFVQMILNFGVSNNANALLQFVVHVQRQIFRALAVFVEESFEVVLNLVFE